MSVEEYNRKYGLNSKDHKKISVTTVTNKPVSNKDIFPSSQATNPQKHSYGVPQVRSVEKKQEAPKREEKPSYVAPSINRIIPKAPEVKTRVIYESPAPQQQQPVPNNADFLQEEYAMGAMGDMGLGSDDPELQMAIMQSMKGSSKNTSSYSFEGIDANESFVAQQKAIE